MREIKFRAWRLLGDDGGRMEKHEHENEAGDFLNEAMSAGMPIMQYTGLKDKNGVEIYEGDIVRILYSDWMSKSDDDPRTLEQYQIEELCVLGNVVFRAPRFVVDLKDNLDCSLIAGTHGWIEVIGNIYENPELLEEPLTEEDKLMIDIDGALGK